MQRGDGAAIAVAGHSQPGALRVLFPQALSRTAHRAAPSARALVGIHAVPHWLPWARPVHNVRPLLSQYKSLFQNAEFVKLIVGFGIGLGVFNALLTERLPLARSAHCTACAVQPPCRVASASTQTRPGSNTQRCSAAMCASMRHRIATPTHVPRATRMRRAATCNVQRTTRCPSVRPAPLLCAALAQSSPTWLAPCTTRRTMSMRRLSTPPTGRSVSFTRPQVRPVLTLTSAKRVCPEGGPAAPPLRGWGRCAAARPAAAALYSFGRPDALLFGRQRRAERLGYLPNQHSRAPLREYRAVLRCTALTLTPPHRKRAEPHSRPVRCRGTAPA